jgi:hypothetical protein
MPREQINYPAPAVIVSGTGIAQRDPALHVSWASGDLDGEHGHVQVAFEADPSYLRMAIDNPNEQADRTSMYTPVLTRSEINRLIRVLKRARDSAYGKDE